VRHKHKLSFVVKEARRTAVADRKGGLKFPQRNDPTSRFAPHALLASAALAANKL
jgi:hypothetical protein